MTQRRSRSGSSVFTVSDLSPQHTWPVQPSAADNAWLEEIAAIPPGDYLLATGDRGVGFLDDAPILNRDITGWWVGRFIGDIHHRGRTLRIVPRLGLPVIEHWLGAIDNVRVLPNTAGNSPLSGALIIQLAAACWQAAVIDAGRHALPAQAQVHLRTGNVVTGRFDVRNTVAFRARGRNSLVSQTKVKSLDNPVTRAVVAADRILDSCMATPQWRDGRVAVSLDRMRRSTGRNPVVPTLDEVSRMKLPPIAARWRTAAVLSVHIATHRMMRHAPTASGTFGLLIDVAELWERFLVRCTQQAVEGTDLHLIHGTTGYEGKHLLQSVLKPGAGLGRMYPDIVVADNQNNTRLVLDAKYKPLTDPRGVDREDLYQLYAYATSASSSAAALGYPCFPDKATDAINAPSRAQQLSPWQDSAGCRYTFTRFPVFARQTTEILRSLIGANLTTGNT